MKSKSWIILALIFLVIGVGVSIYLVSHHYDLLYARQDAKSFCSVNALFDCDAVNTSKFSEIAGIPVALISALTLLVEILLLFAYRAFGESDKVRLARYFFYLTCGNLAASLFLGVVSTFLLKTYCLMCISLYAVSIVSFICGWNLVEGSKFGNLADDMAALFKGSEAGGARGVLILLLLIPAGSALANSMYKDSLSAEVDKIVLNSMMEWPQNKQNTFTFGSPHEEGNKSGKMQIVEFSDFQCPHCRKAAPSLHAFINSHKDDVHFVFQNYPLDSGCNPKMKEAMHPQACVMAKAALCAKKLDKFAEAHDWIFDHQEGLNDSSLADMCKELKLDKANMDACIADTATKDELAREVDQGNLADIGGTPSIFVNGRYLPAGFLIPVLEAALQNIH